MLKTGTFIKPMLFSTPMGLKLDVKDKKILSEIDLNARFFISDIAKKVKLNKEVVKYRIHNLEKKGVINGYRTVINFAKLGLRVVEVSINVMDCSREEFHNMIEFIQSQPNLQLFHECDVIWDLVFRLVVNDIYEFERFYDTFKEKFRRFIEIDQAEFLSSVKLLSRSLLPDSKKSSIEIDYSVHKADFDQTDIKILQIISFDTK